MLRIGLTGGIGSGKSEAAALFAKLGSPVIDTDTIARDLTRPGSDAVSTIRSVFGDTFILFDGSLDRAKLADHVFKNPEDRKKLENILHPLIMQSLLKDMQKLDNAPYVILVIPLLFETGFDELTDRNLVITAPENLRIERVLRRDNRTIEQIQAIMKQQLDEQTRLDRADDILQNSGSLNDLKSEVEKLHQFYSEISAETT